ncbi:hypothetical protein C8Q74DRAFT_1259850 [Fomes fomentarius]|nr:hypothetical protein C8Q74DRAFT_1259850 [Fomes fomentarius]
MRMDIVERCICICSMLSLYPVLASHPRSRRRGGQHVYHDVLWRMTREHIARGASSSSSNLGHTNNTATPIREPADYTTTV